MALDPTISQLLRVQPRKTVATAKAKPNLSATRDTLNQIYKQLGFPEVYRTDNVMVDLFHQRAIGIISDESSSAAAAINRIDKGLMPAVSLARKAGITRLAHLAIEARLCDAAKPIAKKAAESREILDAVMNRRPEDPALALIWQLNVNNARDQLKGMTQGEVIQVALDMAKRGDELFPEVFLNGIKKPIDADMQERLTREYQEALVAPALAEIDEIEDALGECRAVIGCAEIALGKHLSDTCSLPGNWRDVSQETIVSNWNAATAKTFIDAKGVDVYEHVKRGSLDLVEALDVFRPGLTETE